jgi:peroxiredoxin
MQKIYASSLAILGLIGLACMTRAWAADATSDGVPVGGKAPDFTLQDQNGKPVSLSTFAGKIIVLEWTNPNCPFVQRVYSQKTMQKLDDEYSAKGVVWLAINSSAGATNADDKDWATAQAIDYPILNDTDTSVAKAYHATNTPDMFIIGTGGTILYEGAIDNNQYGDKTSGVINYVDQALDETLAGKPVSIPQTKAWGCGVHYRD